jgi:transcription elongation factor GreB
MPDAPKNYITPTGIAAMRAELDQLRRVERPEVVATVSWAAGNGDRSENGDYIYGKKRLRQIDGRIRRLLKRLEIAEVVDPLAQPDKEKIFFGATVTYEDQHGKDRTIRIVGTDEARIEDNEVSWVSPIARALMRKSVGDVASLRAPDGEVEVEVLEIAYEAG